MTDDEELFNLPLSLTPKQIGILKADLFMAREHISQLKAELARYVPTENTLEVFTANDGLLGFRQRTDLYERIETP